MEKKLVLILLVLGIALGGMVALPTATAAGPCNGLVDDNCTYYDGRIGKETTCRQWLGGHCIQG